MSSKKAIIAYCALSMGFTMLSSSFNFYYVKVFLNLYNIEESWFHTAQVLYMVWNAVNDPLFAVCQDNTNFLLTRTRREGILYTAPLFALSFLVPWIPMGKSPWAVGMHLVVALFLYDTMFTFIGLLSCCLFTELSADPHNRLKLTRYSTIASLIGSQSILVLEFASDSLQNFRAFQSAAVILAFCSCLLMIYTGTHAHTQYEKTESDKCAGSSDKEISDSSSDSFFRKMFQLFKEKNFVVFVITNFFQEFHRAFWGGFLAILCEYLVSTDQVPLHVRSFFYGLTGTAGGILVILGTPLVGHLGYFHTIRYNFVWKIVGGLTMYLLIGPGNSWIIMLYMLIDRAFANATFSFFNMPLSDIADADKAKYHRSQPISSTVFGTNALVVKPALSLSPMLVVAILNHYGYEHLKEQKESASATEKAAMSAVMFQLICFFPVVLGFIQLIVWSRFTIRRKITETVIMKETL
ncbi:transmembrane protein 180-like [Babylonia areolata]|uniref:transmembrane protein 180-like n=1 Tax=Babylonia areolata TaxID=304850 RepID=UPI003FD093DB